MPRRSIPPLLIFVCSMMLSRASAWSTVRYRAKHQVVQVVAVAPTRCQMVKEDDSIGSKHSGYNVLGTELSCCCSNVGGSGIGTGFYRNGFCGKQSGGFFLPPQRSKS